MPEEEKPTPEQEAQPEQPKEGEEEQGTPSETAGEEKKEEEKLYAGKYKSPEELEKGYTELNKKLSDLGTKANITERLIEQVMKEQNLSEEGAVEYLNNMSKGELSKETEGEKEKGDELARSEIKRLRWDNAQTKLESDHPELKGSDILQFIKREYEQTGKDPIELFNEKYAPLIEEGKNIAYKNQTDKQKAKPTVGAGELPQKDDLQEAFVLAQKTGDWKPYIKAKGIV